MPKISYWLDYAWSTRFRRSGGPPHHARPAHARAAQHSVSDCTNRATSEHGPQPHRFRLCGWEYLLPSSSESPEVRNMLFNDCLLLAENMCQGWKNLAGIRGPHHTIVHGTQTPRPAFYPNIWHYYIPFPAPAMPWQFSRPKSCRSATTASIVVQCFLACLPPHCSYTAADTEELESTETNPPQRKTALICIVHGF